MLLLECTVPGRGFRFEILPGEALHILCIFSNVSNSFMSINCEVFPPKNLLNAFVVVGGSAWHLVLSFCKSGVARKFFSDSHDSKKKKSLYHFVQAWRSFRSSSWLISPSSTFFMTQTCVSITHAEQEETSISSCSLFNQSVSCILPGLSRFSTPFDRCYPRAQKDTSFEPVGASMSFLQSSKVNESLRVSLITSYSSASVNLLVQ